MRWLALVLVAGCATDPSPYYDPPPPMRPVSLLDAPKLEVVARPGSLYVRLAYGEYGLECALWSPSFRASVNDVPMFVVEGSERDVGIDIPEWECGAPMARFSGSPEGAVLVLADDSTTLQLDLGNALAQRSASLAGGADWTRGMTYDVAWSPATDLTANRPGRASISDGTTTGYGGLTHDASLLHVIMPQASELPYTGAATLRLSWYELPETPTCPNCKLEVSGDVTTQIVVH
jgi:hypothetical protein